jgi:hypothetical protein
MKTELGESIRPTLVTKLVWPYISFHTQDILRPTPVAARPKVFVRSPSLAGTAGSNVAGDMDVCLLGVLCVVRVLCDELIPQRA